MPAPPQTAPTDAEYDAVVEPGFTDPAFDDGFILWEAPPRPPKGGKLTDLNGDLPESVQLTVATPDASKAHGFAFNEPSNPSANAVYQTARLKAKYE